MNVLLFPGQGSQLVGMGSEFYNNFETVKKIYKKADERLGFPLSKIILEGPSDQLQLTKITQPAILTVSYSIFQILKNEFNFDLNSFKFFAGHSLGEYSALVCSGALEFNDAIFLLNERGKAMQSAVPIGNGAMIAVLGLETEELQKFIKKNDTIKGICEIANDNATGQVIISGDKIKIDQIQNNLKEEKIKTIPLKVSAPFHCTLMKQAAEEMKIKIHKTIFKKSSFDIINNVKANVEQDPNKVKKLLVEQIFSTVRWRESLLFMEKAGIKNYIEIGPGKVLSGMVKRTVKDANCFSINSIADIKNFINESKK